MEMDVDLLPLLALFVEVDLLSTWLKVVKYGMELG